jgi:hypothetical protein
MASKPKVSVHHIAPRFPFVVVGSPARLLTAVYLRWYLFRSLVVDLG